MPKFESIDAPDGKTPEASSSKKTVKSKFNEPSQENWLAISQAPERLHSTSPSKEKVNGGHWTNLTSLLGCAWCSWDAAWGPTKPGQLLLPRSQESEWKPKPHPHIVLANNMLKVDVTPSGQGEGEHVASFSFHSMCTFVAQLHRQARMSIQHSRRKFRSQTSDNMDRWKAEQGRGREKRKIRREKIRRERVRRRRCRCAKR